MANNEELYQYLVEQDDENMNTEIDCCDSTSTPNVAVNVENEPMEFSSDILMIAMSFPQPYNS